MLAYAINSIRRRIDDARRVETPGSVFACVDAAEFRSLEALGAVREPTEVEMQLYHLANPVAPQPAAEPTSPPPTLETAQQRKKRLAAEAAAEEAARQAAEAAAEEAARQAAANGDSTETLE